MNVSFNVDALWYQILYLTPPGREVLTFQRRVYHGRHPRHERVKEILKFSPKSMKKKFERRYLGEKLFVFTFFFLMLDHV